MDEKDVPVGSYFLDQLEKAKTTHDRDLARNTLRQIQECVHGDSKRGLDPVPEDAVDACLGIGKGDEPILVGSGTHGQRIYVRPQGGLFMNEDEIHSGKYRKRFVMLFGTEPEISFLKDGNSGL